jgi:2,4-dienoyl-CoA reductase-like NADH-dependent reductase (Old Yellow Enzyme family)
MRTNTFGMRVAEMMLFQPFQVSGLKLKNRVVLVPLVTNLATEDGDVSDELIRRYLRIARGGVGWLITECVVVTPRQSPFNLRISDDRFITGLRRLTDAIHGESDAKIGIQIGHFLKIAKSGYRQKVEDLSKEEIREIHDQHIAAAERIKHCGFDSLEWDAESCMTMSQFLSRKNRRNDEYGGTLENRQRLLLEIYEATREMLGPDYVLGARINGDDLCLGGTTLLHSTKTACELARRGIDYISVSCGGQWEDALPPPPGEPPSAYTGYSGLRCWPRAWDPDGANVYLAERIHQALRKAGYQTPVITAGKIPTAEFAEEVLREGEADLIGLGRPLLCDPDWVKKYLEDRPEDIVRCTYCNHCAEVNDLFQATTCVHWPKGTIQPPDPFLPKKIAGSG